MYLQEFFDYKNQFMKDICCNRNIVTLITDDENSRVPNHTLAYSQIYPYEFVPETVGVGQTFICFDVDIIKVDNKTFYTPVLYVWVFTHKSKLHLPSGGVRTDQLAAEIDNLINGSRFYGLGELELSSVGRFVPIVDYQGRELVYYAKDFNRTGSRPAPTNRKNRLGE